MLLMASTLLHACPDVSSDPVKPTCSILAGRAFAKLCLLCAMSSMAVITGSVACGGHVLPPYLQASSGSAFLSA